MYSILAMALFGSLAYGQSFFVPTSYRGALAPAPTAQWTDNWVNWDPQNTQYPSTQTVINSDVTTNTTWSGVIKLQNKVYVRNGATLTILPGTIIRGDYSTQGTLIVSKGSKLIADGNQMNPIVFTSNNPVGNLFPQTALFSLYSLQPLPVR